MIAGIVSVISALADGITVVVFSKDSYKFFNALRRFIGRPPLFKVHEVRSKVDHNEMWRWNQRVFASRHPRSYEKFDIVSLELGEQWWTRYRQQDWRILDPDGDQIGTYCLIPIIESTFDKLIGNIIIETEISSIDIVDERRIYAHQYWYIANYMIAKRTSGTPRCASECVRHTIEEHMAVRMLKSADFATHFGRDIHVVAVVEAASLERMAIQNGFQKAIPHDRFSPVYSMRISAPMAKKRSAEAAIRRKRAEAKLKAIKRPFFAQPRHHKVMFLSDRDMEARS